MTMSLNRIKRIDMGTTNNGQQKKKKKKAPRIVEINKLSEQQKAWELSGKPRRYVHCIGKRIQADKIR